MRPLFSSEMDCAGPMTKLQEYKYHIARWGCPCNHKTFGLIPWVISGHSVSRQFPDLFTNAELPEQVNFHSLLELAAVQFSAIHNTKHMRELQIYSALAILHVMCLGLFHWARTSNCDRFHFAHVDLGGIKQWIGPCNRKTFGLIPWVISGHSVSRQFPDLFTNAELPEQVNFHILLELAAVQFSAICNTKHTRVTNLQCFGNASCDVSWAFSLHQDKQLQQIWQKSQKICTVQTSWTLTASGYRCMCYRNFITQHSKFACGAWCNPIVCDMQHQLLGFTMDAVLLYMPMPVCP